MSKIISIPNVGNVEFPDSMSDADITQAIESEILPPLDRPPQTPGASKGLSRHRGDVIDQLAARRGGKLPSRDEAIQRPTTPGQIRLAPAKTSNGGFWGGAGRSAKGMVAGPLSDIHTLFTNPREVFYPHVTLDDLARAHREGKAMEAHPLLAALDELGAPNLAGTAAEAERRGAANESTADMYGAVAPAAALLAAPYAVPPILRGAAGALPGRRTAATLQGIDAELDRAALARDQHAALPSPDPSTLSALDDHIANLSDLRSQVTNPGASSLPTRGRAALSAVGNVARGRPAAALRSAATALERPSVSPKTLRSSASSMIASSPAGRVLADIPGPPLPSPPSRAMSVPSRPTFAGDPEGTVYSLDPDDPAGMAFRLDTRPGPTARPVFESSPPAPARSQLVLDALARQRATGRPALPPMSDPSVLPSSGATWTGDTPWNPSFWRGRTGITPAPVEGSGASSLPHRPVPTTAPSSGSPDWLSKIHSSVTSAGDRIAADRTAWAGQQAEAAAREAKTRAAVNKGRDSRSPLPRDLPSPTSPTSELGPHVSVNDEVRFSRGNRRLHGRIKSIVDSKSGKAAVIDTPEHGRHTVLLNDLTRLVRPTG